MRVFRILATVLFLVAIPTALLTSTIRFVANEGRVYRYAIDQFGAEQTTGIERDQLIQAGSELRAYFNSGDETPTIRVQQDGRDVNLFNPRETAHLEDVKDRFVLVNRIQEFSVLYVLAFISIVVLWAREFSARALAVMCLGASVATLVVVGAAGAIGAAGFNSAWTNFHEVIFSNDFWLLNPRTDHLIQMFPPEFWERIVFFIGLLIATEAALLLITSAIYIGVSGHQRSRQRLEPNYA